MLLEPGDVVLVEEPSYLAALQAFCSRARASCRSPCDDDGLDPDAVAALGARERRAAALHDPDVPQPDRAHAAAGAPPRAGRGRRARAGCGCVEDDPYGELRYRGEPLPSARALPGAADRTLALSTLLEGRGARGCGSAGCGRPRRCAASLVIAKQAADLHSSTVDQAAAARWLADRRPRRPHRPPARRVRRAPRRAARRASPAALPAGLDATTARTAACSCGRGCPTAGTPRICSRSRSPTTSAFVPGYPFFAGEPDRATLRFSFTTHTPDEIAEGLARLHDAWH